MKILHGNNGGTTAQIAFGDFDRILIAAFGARIFLALGIFFLVFEFQRVMRHIGQVYQLVNALIKKCIKTFFRANTHMMVAARTDFLQIFQIAMKNHLAAFFTRLP
jgi:type II secretory pathway component PulF